MKTIKSTALYEAETDGKTLWINGPILLGRFSRFGVDVHVDGACIDGSCKAEPDWEHFVELMKKHHNIDPTPFREHLTWMP